MRMTDTKLGAFAAVALLLGAGVAHADLVQDGSFENATYTGGANGSFIAAPGSLGDGWSVSAGQIQVENASDGYGVPYAGSQFVYLDYGSSLNTLSQTLTTAVGQDYTVSFRVADDAADPLEVTFGSTVLFNGTAPTNGISAASDYVLESFTATATSTSTVLSFSGSYNTTGNGTNLDNVSVTALASPPSLPEPASLALLGTGVALLSLRRRRGSV